MGYMHETIGRVAVNYALKRRRKQIVLGAGATAVAILGVAAVASYFGARGVARGRGTTSAN